MRMKPSQLATIFLICIVLTATALAQNSASPQAPSPSKSTHAAKPTRAAKTASNAMPGLAAFDESVLKTMKDWKVPGAAVAIVKDGKVILSKGYGLRDVKGNL